MGTKGVDEMKEETSKKKFIKSCAVTSEMYASDLTIFFTLSLWNNYLFFIIEIN